jgi:hypothetical protein
LDYDELYKEALNIITKNRDAGTRRFAIHGRFYPNGSELSCVMLIISFRLSW